jgi:hypothetical protein
MNMKASEIMEIIKCEIDDNWTISNAHGVDLRKCLLPQPVKKAYEDSFKEGKIIELWLVLEEISEDESGLRIVFDEESQMFGLAVSGVRRMMYLLASMGHFLKRSKQCNYQFGLLKCIHWTAYSNR